MNAFRTLILGLLATTFLAGCTSVTFEEPMPLNHRDLPRFPKHWRGEWLDESGERLHIGEQHVMSDDSSEVYILGAENRLRRYRDCLVFNSKDDGGGWNVVLARRRGGTIQLYHFDGSDEQKVAVWRAILNASEDAATAFTTKGAGPKPSYHLAPENNAAWRQLVKENALTPLASYVRVEE